LSIGGRETDAKGARGSRQRQHSHHGCLRARGTDP
jgi:hypothetical protein